MKVRMWAILLAISALLLGMGSFAIPPARAAVVQPARRLPLEQRKITLDEESIDGPAIWSYGGTQLATAPNVVLAWTGIDAFHSLNVMTSQDGLHYANKITVGEYSLSKPAVVVARANDTNYTILAWTGTDPNHSLNLMFDVYGRRIVTTLADGSPFSPALTQGNDGRVWLAWAAKAVGGGMAVEPFTITPQGLQAGQKVSIAQYQSISSPALTFDSANHQLALSWADTGQSRYLPQPLPFINIIVSRDGSTWAPAFSPPAPQLSTVGPALLNASIPDLKSIYFWSWAGTDQLHSLNLATTSTITSWPAPITTYDEQCYGGPAIGATLYGPALFLGWTGIDPLHHLNIAVVIV